MSDATAAVLRKSRRMSELTLRELADRAATSHSTLAAYESGAKRPNMATFLRVIDAAGNEVEFRLTRRQRGTQQLNRGDELVAVLELAAQFPAHHEPELTYPRLWGTRC